MTTGSVTDPYSFPGGGGFDRRDVQQSQDAPGAGQQGPHERPDDARRTGDENALIRHG
jgi:hypothetical protein